MGVLSMIRSFEKLNGPIRANVNVLPDGKVYYRLVINIIDDEHTVYVGNDSVRIFTSDTLPSMLKHRLAIIKSRPKGANESDARISIFLPSDLGEDNEMGMIGWSASEYNYVVIVSQEELEYLVVST